ncbi:hypothetical protein ARMGADRAFT_1069220 [Armillaria gallica]|uniref:Uncharacterized protein n=1 Tax=Armillaria gallica TaxID=47427 RepID=A0A2H3CA32_ARMGA|nr:hypothetical protein ARMGADRAFT_1069220 [Armillaria gallica]
MGMEPSLRTQTLRMRLFPCIHIIECKGSAALIIILSQAPSVISGRGRLDGTEVSKIKSLPNGVHFWHDDQHFQFLGSLVPCVTTKKKVIGAVHNISVNNIKILRREHHRVYWDSYREWQSGFHLGRSPAICQETRVCSASFEVLPTFQIRPTMID